MNQCIFPSDILQEKDQNSNLLKQDIIFIRELFKFDQEENDTKLKTLSTHFIEYINNSQNHHLYYANLISLYIKTRPHNSKTAISLFDALCSVFPEEEQMLLKYIKTNKILFHSNHTN